MSLLLVATIVDRIINTASPNLIIFYITPISAKSKILMEENKNKSELI
jgi:hypothetical protein